MSVCQMSDAFSHFRPLKLCIAVCSDMLLTSKITFFSGKDLPHSNHSYISAQKLFPGSKKGFGDAFLSHEYFQLTWKE